MDSLYQKIYTKVSEIPQGSVTSYGIIARAVDLANGARTVGWALQKLPPDSNVPWYRVVNKDGYLTILHPIVNASTQKRLLEQEGIILTKQNNLWRVESPHWHKYQDSR